MKKLFNPPSQNSTIVRSRMQNERLPASADFIWQQNKNINSPCVSLGGFNKPIRILLVTKSLILVSGAMLGPIYALFVEKIGGDLLDASYAFGIYALAAGITTLISGKYADRVKENELIVVFGYGIMGLAFFGFNAMFIVMGLLSFASAVYILKLPRKVL